MRQTADALRQGAARDGQQQDLARTLDRVAEQLGEASGTRDADSRRYSDQLARTQELRDKVQEIDRHIEQLKREGQQGQPQPGQSRPGQEQQGRAQQGQPQQGPPQPGQAQGQAQSGQSQPSQSPSGQTPGQSQQTGPGAGGNGGLEQLQRDVNEQMRDAERLTDEPASRQSGDAGAA